MATKTSNGTGGGDWSAGATWAGGIAPVDGDTVVIAAGDTVTFDADLSAYVTGIAGITVTSHATTPATLAFKSDADGTYYLRLKAGTNIVGTNAAAHGRLLMAGGTWANPSDAAFGRKMVIEFLGTTAGYVDMTYLDVIARGINPAHLYATTYGTAYPVSSVNPTTDVIDLGAAPPVAGTAVIVRSTGTLPGGLTDTGVYYVRNVVGNTCQLATQNLGAAIVNLTSAGTGTITVYTGAASGSATVNVIENLTADAQWVAAATLWANGASHNAAVLVNSTAPANYDIQRTSITTINAGSIVLADVVDSTQYPGAQIFLASRNVRIVSNTTSGTAPIVANGTGAILQCEIRALAGTGVTFYAHGVSAGTSHTISGVISGCTNGVNSGTTHTISGVISGCTNGILYGATHTISGVISGCNNGINYGSTILTNSAVFIGNTYDLRSVGYLIGFGAQLNSVTQNYQYLQSPADDWRTNCIYDIGGLGQIKAWTNGGNIVTEAAPGTPPVSLDYAYKHSGEVAASSTWVDIPLYGRKNQALAVTIYEKCNANPSTFTTGPTFEIIDPGYIWGTPAAILASATALSAGDDTNWHTLTLSYTPTANRPLILRARMNDASKYFHWGFSITGGGISRARLVNSGGV